MKKRLIVTLGTVVIFGLLATALMALPRDHRGISHAVRRSAFVQLEDNCGSLEQDNRDWYRYMEEHYERADGPYGHMGR